VSNSITLTIGGSLDLVLRTPEPVLIPVISVRYAQFRLTARGDHMAYQLPADHQIEVRVDYVDAGGNPAAVDGPVEWSVAPDGIVTVTPDGSDSQLCMLTPVGPAGNCQVSVTADADLGAGIKSLVTMLDVSVIAGEAVAGTITPVCSPTPIP